MRCPHCDARLTPGIDKHVDAMKLREHTIEDTRDLLKLAMYGEVRGVEPPEVEHRGDGITIVRFPDSLKMAIAENGNFALTVTATEMFIEALRKRGN